MCSKTCSFSSNLLMFGLCVVLLTQISSCGYQSAGKAYARLVDYNCTPIPDKAISIANNVLNQLFSSGHTTVDEYVTDESGLFEFNIERAADNLDAFVYPPASRKPQFLRNFGHGYHSLEKSNLLKTTPENRVVIYFPDSHDEDDYIGRFEDQIHMLRLDKKINKSMVTVVNSRVLHIHTGIKEGEKTIELYAMKGGDIAEVKIINNRNITVGPASKSVTLYQREKPVEYIYYVVFGNERKASLVKIMLPESSKENNITLLVFAQLIPLSMRESNNVIPVNLEGCGGAMRRGVHNRSMELSNEEKNQISIASRATQPQPVDEWISKIDYINTQEDLDELVNMPGLSEPIFVELIQYDIIRGDLFGNLYPMLRNKNWNKAIRAIGKDSRTGESTVVDIINSMPAEDRMTPTYLSSFIQNPSINAATTSVAITVFEKVSRLDSEADHFIKVILESGISIGRLHKEYTPAQQDVKVIQSFLDQQYAKISDEAKKTEIALKLSRYPYVSGSLLERAYYHVKETGSYKYELRGWLNNPTTPISILELISEYPLNLKMNDLGNQDTTQEMIAKLLDHPNSTVELRNKFYSLLEDVNTDKHILKYYIAPGISAAKNNPSRIFKKLVEYELTGKSSALKWLLNNPSLPVSLSEKLVARYGCLNGWANDSYARLHFNKMPGSNCFLAAAKSKITPAPIMRKILSEHKIGKSSELIKTAQIPDETMRLLYCRNKGYVMEDLAYNPYTPEDILVDLFENSHSIRVIDGLTVNPAVPQWMLEKIYLNDYVVRNPNRFRIHMERRLSCNPKLPISVRKNLKYTGPNDRCVSDVMAWNDIEQIASKRGAKDAIDCVNYNQKNPLIRLPEVKILNYGILKFKESEIVKMEPGVRSEHGTFEVVEHTTSIPKLLGLEFGVTYEISGSFPDGNADIEFVTMFFEKGVPNSVEDAPEFIDSQTLKIESKSVGKHASLVIFNEHSDLKSGKWVFQVRCNDSILTEKIFVVQ